MVEPNVSALYVDAFVDCVGRRGLPRERLRDATGAGAAPLRRVSASAFCALIERGARELGDPTVGLAFGSEIGGRGFGLLGIATASAGTLAGAIRCLATMESLTSTLGQVAPQREGDVVHLRWQPHVHALPPPVIEGIVAGWASFGRFLLGDQAPVLRVSFRHPAPAARAKYEDVFAAQVRFGAAEDSLTVPAELLDAAVRFGDATLHESLWAWSEDCQRLARAPSGGLIRRVVAAIERGLPWEVAGEDEVARAVGLSRRSLQRALHAQDLSYRRVLDCVRGKLAFGAVMEGPSSLVEVAGRAGYAEQASFCRSFRRWSGLAPSDFVRKFPPGFFDPRAAG